MPRKPQNLPAKNPMINLNGVWPTRAYCSTCEHLAFGESGEFSCKITPPGTEADFRGRACSLYSRAEVRRWKKMSRIDVTCPVCGKVRNILRKGRRGIDSPCTSCAAGMRDPSKGQAMRINGCLVVPAAVGRCDEYLSCPNYLDCLWKIGSTLWNGWRRHGYLY